MKYLLSICVIVMLVCVTNTQAQNQYTVEGHKYTLNTEVEGTITLLWTTVNDEYRYFIKKESLMKAALAFVEELKQAAGQGNS